MRTDASSQTASHAVLSVRFTVEELARIREIARSTERSAGQVVRIAVRRGLAAGEPK